MADRPSPSPDPPQEPSPPANARPTTHAAEPAEADQAIDIAGTEADDPPVGEAVESRQPAHPTRDAAVDGSTR